VLRIRDVLTWIRIRNFFHPGSWIRHKEWDANLLYSCFFWFQDPGVNKSTGSRIRNTGYDGSFNIFVDLILAMTSVTDPGCFNLDADPKFFSSRILHEEWDATLLFSGFLWFQEQSVGLLVIVKKIRKKFIPVPGSRG
jgi:hypothetical protein